MELWKRIPGTSYEVSNTGQIKTLDRVVKCGKRIKLHIVERVMSTRIHNGYVYIGLRIDGKTVSRPVHRLVASAFLPNPNNYRCVNHKDGNKQNNNVDNLEWCNHTQNITHAYRTGLKVAKGVRKLTVEQAAEIRELAKTKMGTEIARIYGVSKATVNKIIHHKTPGYD